MKEENAEDHLRRNVIMLRSSLAKYDDLEDEGAKKKLQRGKSMIGEKIYQNFSKHGGRLTSTEALGALQLRDKIVTAFTVADSVTVDNKKVWRPKPMV